MSPRFPPWVLALAVTACVAAPPPSSAPSSEPLLAPGPFAVGFRSTWGLDEGRTYRTAFDDGRTYGAQGAPRPVLVNLWYPAEPAAARAEPMPHGRYLELASDDARLAPLARALAAHARGIFVQQVMGRAEAELDAAERAELEAALDAPSACRAGAAPARGPFPLVIYHAGAGSSFEDDAALCEHLASHGYVVVGSAFLRADGSSLGIDAGRGSSEDVQFLVRLARSMPFVDARRVGLVGHSAGAQALLRHAAQPGAVGDALVLLDTTQDYYALGMPLHEEVVREASAGKAWLTRPMLVAAGPEAIFALVDTLVDAERAYLTLPDLGHDEYLSQGLQRLARIARHEARSPGGPDAPEAARLESVRASYRALCECVRSFLDAELLDRRADLAARIVPERAWSPLVPCLVRVPRGVDGPEPYDPAGDAPPSPRQFRRLFHENGVEAACAVLERFRGAEPRGPLYTGSMLAGSLLHGLVESGRRDEAARYYATLQAVSVRVLVLFEFLADVSRMQQEPERALHFLRIAHELDPADEGIASKLRELEDPPAGGQ